MRAYRAVAYRPTGVVPLSRLFPIACMLAFCLAAVPGIQGLAPRAFADQGPVAANGTVNIQNVYTGDNGATLYDANAVLEDPFGGSGTRFNIPLRGVEGIGDDQSMKLVNGAMFHARFTDVTLSDGAPSDAFVTNAVGSGMWDDRSGVSTSQTMLFAATTPDATLALVVPASCVLHIVNDAGTHDAGETAILSPGQSFYFTTADPAAAAGADGVMKGSGVATVAKSERMQGHISAPLLSPGGMDMPGFQRIEHDFDTLVATGSSAQVSLSYAVRWTATVRYYVDDNELVATDESPLTAHYSIPAHVQAAAAKPNCTPGLDPNAWRDASGAIFADGSPLTDDMELRNKNKVTVAFMHGDPQGPDSPDPDAAPTRLYANRSDATPLTQTWADLLPPSKTVTWGALVTLPPPKDGIDAFWYEQDDRWKTMRRSDEGWHLSPTGSDQVLTSVKAEGDMTLYDDWSHSVIDAVVSE